MKKIFVDQNHYYDWFFSFCLFVQWKWFFFFISFNETFWNINCVEGGANDEQNHLKSWWWWWLMAGSIGASTTFPLLNYHFSLSRSLRFLHLKIHIFLQINLDISTSSKWISFGIIIIIIMFAMKNSWENKKGQSVNNDDIKRERKRESFIFFLFQFQNYIFTSSS